MTVAASNHKSPRPLGAAVGRLLVVDDNEMNRDLLSRRLSRRGHSVELAEDGQKAIDLIASEPFDVVLLDIMMPGIDGMEVLRIVRETHSAADLPIIMATAKDESEDVVAALKLGANDYVTKPLDFQVVLARVQTQLALKRANDALTAAHARMKRDLEAAARVQQALLPASLPATDRARFAWHYQPCDELAGDSLNLFKIDSRFVCMYVLDVSGHGVPAALLSVAVTRSLTPTVDASSLVTEASDEQGASDIQLSELACRLNAIYPMKSNASHYFTLVFGILDTHTGGFRFVAAGHPGPIVVRPGEPPALVDVPGFPIGIVPEADFEETCIELRPGDRMYLHSDGINEEMNKSSEQFGRERLASVLGKCAEQSLEESLESVVNEITSWRGDNNFTDDVSILGVEMLNHSSD